MALFKIYRGLETNLPTTITDGVAYFCKDTGNYYIDFLMDGTPTRSKISAKYADKLRYVADGKSVEIDPATILTDDNYISKIGMASSAKAGLMAVADKNKLDTVAEGANKTVVDEALSDTSINPVQNKTVKAALDAKAGLDVATAASNGLMSKEDKEKLDGVLANAQPNQNAYSKFTVGATTIEADAEADELTIVAGTNVTITADADADQIVIAAKDTTYSLATAEADGLMSKSDKDKLDGIAEGANNYVLPAATTDTLGGVKVGKNLAVAEDGTISATDTIYEVATTTKDGLMASEDKEKLDGIAENATRVLVDSALDASSTNAIQNKVVKEALDGKADEGHTHDYIPTAEKGAANGVAPLDENKLIPASYLPSYVDDVVEVENFDALPDAGEDGKIYVTLNDNLTYRWGGTTYVEISKSLALGTTADTAAAGNHIHEPATSTANGFMSAEDKEKLDGIAQGANNYTLPAATADTLGGIKVGTNLTIDDGVLSAVDTIYEVATTSKEGLMSAADKTKLDGVAEGANKTIVDAALDAASTNPVQNKVVKEALDGKSDAGHKHTEYENQNAFSVIQIGAATIEADSATDTIVLEAGSNVTITPDAEAGKIVVAAKDTTYVEATTAAAGLMSAADKTKLDGVATGAQVNVLEGVTSDSLKVGAITEKKVQLDIEWLEF